MKGELALAKEDRKWVRYEREYSNSMWHAGCKRLDDGRRFAACQDDASRFITGYGVFEDATAENAMAVLEDAIENRGKPASIVTERGSPFFASESEAEGGGGSEYEKKLVELEIRQTLARVRHPHTNAKLARFCGELQRKLNWFKDAAGPPGAGPPVGAGKIEADPTARFVRWYNRDRPHESLDRDALETPARAFMRKAPPKDGGAP